MDSVEVRVTALFVICLGHAMICHKPKTTRDCSVSKTTINNMISFPFLFRYFLYGGKTTMTYSAVNVF